MDRFTLPVVQNHEQISSERYERSKTKSKPKGRIFKPQNDFTFDGIIKYLRNKSNGDIENKINITSSSFYSSCFPKNVVFYEDTNKFFRTNTSALNSWICFEFKENRVIPSSYQIMSIPFGSSINHLKSWVVEGSNDNSRWEKLDEHNNCSALNGNCNSHLFTIENQSQNEYRFIRIRLTGPDWNDQNYLMLGSVEFYGRLK